MVSALYGIHRVRFAPLMLLVLLAGCGSPTGPTPPPPMLQVGCPANMEIQSQDGQAVTVNYATPTATGGVQPVTVSCVPAAGLFPVGNHTIACRATDAAGNSSLCTFVVAVRPPPTLSATRFMAFGDSITAGVVSPLATVLMLVESDSYPFKLQILLTTRYPTQSFTVINAGVPGEKAYIGGQGRFRTALLGNRPEAVLLMEGTNDLLDGETIIPTTIAALQSMVVQARSQNVRVLLATVPPQRAGGRRDAVAKLIPTFNAAVKALAERENLPVVDIYAAMEGNIAQLIGQDDLHPTAQGYDVIAATFADRIKVVFEITQSTMLSR